MPLSDNYEGFWGCSEASGTRYDEQGTSHLTGDNNSVGQSAAGAPGGLPCADIEQGLNQWLSCPTNSVVSLANEDFTFMAFANPEAKTTLMTVLSKYSASSAYYALYYYNVSDRWVWEVGGSGGAHGVIGNNFGSVSTATWCCLCGRHDAANDQISLSVNAGTPDTAAHAGGIGTNAADFEIGKFGSLVSHFDGLVWRVALWRRLLSTQDEIDVYNGGLGLSHAEILAFGGGGPAGQPTMKRFGGTPHMGVGGLKGGFGGGAWGRTKDHVIIPRWLADERQAA